MAREEVAALGQRWADAELRGDAETLFGLLAEDFVGIGPRGFILGRDQWLDRYRSGNLQNEAFAFQEVTVREYGAAAIAVGIQAQRATHQGHDASGRFRVALVAVRRAGCWQIAGLQLSGPLPDALASRG